MLGFFVLMEGSGKIIAAYLFTILNASQVSSLVKTCKWCHMYNEKM